LKWVELFALHVGAGDDRNWVQVVFTGSALNAAILQKIKKFVDLPNEITGRQPEGMGGE
jgi:hypothetical protein